MDDDGIRLLSAIVECAKCMEEYQGYWTDDSIAQQDRAEAPVAAQTCPACGYVQEEAYPGWSYFTEAG
jgi:hypothetical protein